MKFNKKLSVELQEILENQYRGYVANTPMTKNEKKALYEWVKEGNSVYENDKNAWYAGGVPVDFLHVYRGRKNGTSNNWYIV